jgi:hypothetical protein
VSKRHKIDQREHTKKKTQLTESKPMLTGGKPMPENPKGKILTTRTLATKALIAMQRTKAKKPSLKQTNPLLLRMQNLV